MNDSFPFSFAGETLQKNMYVAVFKMLSPSALILKLTGVCDSSRTFKIKDRSGKLAQNIWRRTEAWCCQLKSPSKSFHSSFFESRNGFSIGMHLNPKVDMNSLKGKRGVAEPGSNCHRFCVNGLGAQLIKLRGKDSL